jgi:hypothetical protein
MRWPILGLVFVAVTGWPAGTDAASQSPTESSIIVAEVRASVASLTPADHARILVDLAHAALDAGNADAARAALLDAAPLLRFPTSLYIESPIEQEVRLLGRIGEIAAAETLIAAASDPGVKITLIGDLGAGLAANGDTESSLGRVNQAIREYNAIKPRPDVIVEALSRALTSVGLAMAAQGSVDSAYRVAMAQPRPIDKAWLLGDSAYQRCIGVAAKLERLGTTEPPEVKALRALAAAEIAAPSRATPNQNARPVVLIQMARALAACGQPVAARDAVNALVPPDEADRALGIAADILGAKADAVNQAIALDMTRDLPNDPVRLLSVAQRKSRSGDNAAARAILQRAAGETRRQFQLPSPAPALAETTMVDVIKAQIAAGAYQDALSSIDTISWLSRPQFMISLFAEAMARGDPETAKWATQKASEWAHGSVTNLAKLAKTLAEAGAIEPARASLNSALATADRGWGGTDRRDVAIAQASVGDFAGAQATLAAMTSGWINVFGLDQSKVAKLEVARALEKRHDFVHALEMIEAAGGPAIALPLASLAEAQARAKDTSGAVATAKRIDDARTRASTLVRILKLEGRGP